jgi:hypothetical protein
MKLSLFLFILLFLCSVEPFCFKFFNYSWFSGTTYACFDDQSLFWCIAFVSACKPCWLNKSFPGYSKCWSISFHSKAFTRIPWNIFPAVYGFISLNSSESYAGSWIAGTSSYGIEKSFRMYYS